MSETERDREKEREREREKERERERYHDNDREKQRWCAMIIKNQDMKCFEINDMLFIELKSIPMQNLLFVSHYKH